MESGRSPKPIGVAIVGAGRIGLIRGEIAARHPSVGWIGVAETLADRGKQVSERIHADFVTTDFRELLRRPEVTAAVIATDEHLHVDPILAAVERGASLLIEKPLATDLAESARVLAAIQQSGTSTSSRATRRATSRSASCGVRCARKPTRGSRAWRSATPPRTRRRPKPTTASC